MVALSCVTKDGVCCQNLFYLISPLYLFIIISHFHIITHTLLIRNTIPKTPGKSYEFRGIFVVLILFILLEIKPHAMAENGCIFQSKRLLTGINVNYLLNLDIQLTAKVPPESYHISRCNV